MPNYVKRGNLLVTLYVYPDRITPRYGSFDRLSTEDMAPEGWVYRTLDEVTQKLGKAILHLDPIHPDGIAERFNMGQWRSIFDVLCVHLQLTQQLIELTTSASMTTPGSCQSASAGEHQDPRKSKYTITINEQFLADPFAIAAILAHELCHVVYFEKIGQRPASGGYLFFTEKDTLTLERTVDLLVFVFKLGEFQLRVARDRRLTLGYFNQDVFERMQVIVSKRLQTL